MNNIKTIFAFALGAAIGVVVTRNFFKTKYENIANEEIESVKESYARRKKCEDEAKELIKEVCDRRGYKLDERGEYVRMVNNLGYSDDKKDEETDPDIEVIPPDEFGKDDDYDLIGFTYYANGVLTDDGDFPIDDVESVVGPDALDSFGEWEDDVVYVINRKRKCYYEILKDNSDYVYKDEQEEE